MSLSVALASLLLALRLPSDASSPSCPVPLQPLAQHARLLERALSYLGQPLAPEDHDRINRATSGTDEAAACAEIEATLDRYVLLVVAINPESRVKVTLGSARPELVASAPARASSTTSSRRRRNSGRSRRGMVSTT
jgi:hypothetical protein